MATLLQTLILETLKKDINIENEDTDIEYEDTEHEDTESILISFIKHLLPAIEREFAFTYALGGDEADHYRRLVPKHGAAKAKEIAEKRANKPDQSLLVHVLNALLIAWNLSKHLSPSDQLTEIEKRLLCLGMTLHDYGKQLYSQEQETPRAYEIPEILAVCHSLGETLGFADFWEDWQEYLLEIAFLAQNTQFNVGSNSIPANWEIDDREFTLDDRRLANLRHLLAFGDIAVHMQDPAEIATTTAGDRLRDHLDFLGISQKLVYHRLRDCRGLLTNQIHNAIVSLARELDWEPILYFAQGAVYLAPPPSTPPTLEQLQAAIWQNIIQGNADTNHRGLATYFQTGEIGFVRDGKGLKVAPQTLELFSPAVLISHLPEVVKAKVANFKVLATPKRLEKLAIDPIEKERLTKAANIWADRLAEFIFLIQKEFFPLGEDYALKVLELLELPTQFSPAQTALQSGGVNYGWYHVAATYVANHPTWNDEQFFNLLENLSDRLIAWAEANNLLKQQTSPTQIAFSSYLQQYLEVSASSQPTATFEQELAAYTEAKAKNQPICSISSGEFAAEDQLDAVVLFKPQQYSNKNSLGGGRIKRGISKIWSLEMLLRQAYWAVPAGKLEEQQPIFLYIFPAYVYAPQIALAVRRLLKEFKRTNLWEVRKQWLEAHMQLDGLQQLPWREDEEPEIGRHQESYSLRDLPFMAIAHTTTRGKTLTDAWVAPAFLALALPMLLGVKVVATSSPDPLYSSDQEFSASVIFDGAASFWNLLGNSASLRLQDLPPTLERLLMAYSLHLECRSSPPDARWQAFNGTVRDLATDVLNVFAIAQEGLREDQREPSPEEIERYWQYAQLWAKGDQQRSQSMEFTEKLVREYRQFYQVKIRESSHSILLPLSKALELILSSSSHTQAETLILQGSGQLHDAIQRQEIYKRPLMMDKSVEPARRYEQELEAIKAFMTTCVNEVFLVEYKGDRALLQENRNRIKSGAEFAYRWLALQEKQAQTEPTKPTEENTQNQANNQ